MCGIFGSIQNHGVSPSILQQKVSGLQHRGPDDSGTYINDSVALAHTRLSLLDLSEHGHQPMISACTNYVLVYNGEIYNFKQIRQALTAKGHFFHSDSDTEVLLQGFIEYGDAIVNMLNGMFAFAIYNKREDSLFLARDRSGIKPLYYRLTQDGLMFASEAKLLEQKTVAADSEANILYLLLGYVPEPWTIYEDTHMLPAGNYGYFKHSTLKLTCFSQYQYEDKIHKPYPEIVKDVRHLLEQSIERQLVSDAPIGMFLSGGLDSSCITALAAKYKDDLRTLSLVFKEGDLNEEYYQDLIAKQFGTQHTKYVIDDELFLSSINDFFAASDQPTIDGLNTYFVSKAAAESGLKTVLSGVGSDEIFYGYPSFKDTNKLSWLAKLPHTLIAVLANSRKYKKLELLEAERDLAYYLPRRGLFTPTEIASIIGIDRIRIYELIAKLWRTYDTSHINLMKDKVSSLELNMYMKNQLLRDSDIFSMAHSLEIRVPFLDNDLVDYVLRVEPREKFGKHNKQLLVDAVKDFLPSDIFTRPKMGFTLPFKFWFKRHIDKFDVDSKTKNDFLAGHLSWQKCWALLVLSKYRNLG